MSREIPILFRDELVLRILADEQDLTRRVGPRWARVKPGDRLRVRETFALPACVDDLSPSATGLLALDAGYRNPWAPTWFRSDGHYNNAVAPPDATYDWGGRGRWRPSIHMPRWACRLVLEVVSVTRTATSSCTNTCVETLADVGRCQASHCGRPHGSVCTVLPDLDDAEARREGLADRAAFLALWAKLHPDHVGPVYRVQFRRLP